MAFDKAAVARLKRRMAAIPKRVREAAERQLDADADELVAAQKRVAPVAEVDGGELRDSIRKQDASTEGRIARTVLAGGPTTTRPVRKGASVKYDYAVGQELGTKKMPANPYFYPPYRARRRKFKARLSAAMKKAIREGANTP